MIVQLPFCTLNHVSWKKKTKQVLASPRLNPIWYGGGGGGGIHPLGGFSSTVPKRLALES